MYTSGKDNFSSDPTVSSEAREKADRNGKRIDEQAFEHIKANPKNTKITAVGTINEMTKAQLDGLCAKGQQGDIEQSNSQGESGEVKNLLQTRGFQVECVTG